MVGQRDLVDASMHPGSPWKMRIGVAFLRAKPLVFITYASVSDSDSSCLTGVVEADLLEGGWTKCYEESYADQG